METRVLTQPLPSRHPELYQFEQTSYPASGEQRITIHLRERILKDGETIWSSEHSEENDRFSEFGESIVHRIAQIKGVKDVWVKPYAIEINHARMYDFREIIQAVEPILVEALTNEILNLGHQNTDPGKVFLSTFLHEDDPANILNEEEAAAFLDTTVEQMETMRQKSEGPGWHWIPSLQKHYYALDVLQAWKEETQQEVAVGTEGD